MIKNQTRPLTGRKSSRTQRPHLLSCRFGFVQQTEYFLFLTFLLRNCEVLSGTEILAPSCIARIEFTHLRELSEALDLS